jgi:hypothetical protein
MIKADFYTSIVFVLLGLATAFESYRMPRLENQGVNPYSVPGLVPGILGVIITLLGLTLLLRSVKSLARPADGPPPRGELPHLSYVRLAATLVLSIGYAAGLVGLIPFWLATFVFVSMFIVMFEWQPERNMSASVRAVAAAIVIGALVSAVVTSVFRYIFLVQLP